MSGMNQRDSSSDSILKAAHAAGAAKGAVKTGKTLANMTKGGAAGPYGMAAAGLWEGRHALLKVILAMAAALMLPILFILMLPSLIFGGGGLNDVPNNVLNDQSIIMKNIADTETQIESILRNKHDILLGKIETEADELDTNCEYGITDDFADGIVYESTLIISQFCASQKNFQEVNLTNLEKLLQEGTDSIFSYTVKITSWEETNEDTGDSETHYHYEYVVEYAGSSYFADHVFHLTETQAATAAYYASNLHLFLIDTVYHVKINPDLNPDETGNAAVDFALTKLGTPYSQELRNQEGYFDCSSFTYWVYRHLDISLQYDGSNTAAAQGRYIAENNLAISYDSLAPGDLIFYSFKVNNRYLNISHIAIYAGDGYVVDASYSKKKVVYRPIFSTNNIVLCGRPYVSP